MENPIKLIEQIDSTIIKDGSSSIVLKSANYKINYKQVNNLMVMSGYQVVLPTVFEMDLSGYNDPNTIINSVVKVANNISIKQYDIFDCPICGYKLFHIDNHVLCSNVDCICNEDNDLLLRMKLVILIPSVPNRDILNIIELSNDQSPTINSIIETAIWNFSYKEPNGYVKELLEQFLTAVGEIKPNNLFYAVLGSPLSIDIVKAIDYYENKFESMMVDIDTVFEKLYYEQVSDRARLMMYSILNNNRRLIDNIHQAIEIMR
jgi:hypothetical protein